MSDEPKGGKLYPFNEGLPTKPDVDVLMRIWPDPKPGDRFDYPTIERLLRLKRHDVRFRTVTNKWRDRLLDEKAISVQVDKGEAFFCETLAEASARTSGVIRGIGRKAHGHRVVLVTVRPETEDQRITSEHQARLMLAIEKDAKKHRMNLLPNTAAPAQPQIAPPDTTKARGQ